jgi:hypothetical protein
MTRRPIITLLSDFGLHDAYVGMMKGVILGRCPEARLVDLTHDIPAQQVASAAYVLGSAWRYFSPNTVHLAVVDPGVGTDRRVLVARCDHHWFVGPDNGLFSEVFTDVPPDLLIAVQSTDLFCKPISRTFHGRDIFAPLAAALGRQIDPQQLGTPIDDPVMLPIAPPAAKPDGALHGRVIHVDHFGNLITTIRATQMPFRPIIRIGDRAIHGLVSNYGSVDSGTLVALIGSSGRLEISVSHGSAARQLDAGIDDAVSVEPGSLD